MDEAIGEVRMVLGYGPHGMFANAKLRVRKAAHNERVVTCTAESIEDDCVLKNRCTQYLTDFLEGYAT